MSETKQLTRDCYDSFHRKFIQPIRVNILWVPPSTKIHVVKFPRRKAVAAIPISIRPKLMQGAAVSD
jgi:hypothetical protein